MSHNNFTKGDQRSKQWRLWIAWHPGSLPYKKYPKGTAVYYNYEPNVTKNRDALIRRCVYEREEHGYIGSFNDIQKAILYNNQTGEKIQTIK